MRLSETSLIIRICLLVKIRIVYKVSDNSIVDECFVLRPDRDPAAKAALLAYEDATDNVALADDIRRWMDTIN